MTLCRLLHSGRTIFTKRVISRIISRSFITWDLGIESFQRDRFLIAATVEPVRNQFINRMNTQMKNDATIYTEDLKTLINIADSDKDLELLVKMIYKYNNQGLNSNWEFGPIILRMCYVLDRTDLAFQLYTDKTLKHMFNTHSSTIILMEKLFKEGRYTKVVDIVNTLHDDGNIFRSSNNFSILLLLLASLFKQNTPESYDKMMHVLKEWENRKDNYTFPSRAAGFAILLALKQRHPTIAENLISLLFSKDISCPTITVVFNNCKTLTLTELKRYKHALHFLENNITSDSQSENEVFRDVLEQLEVAIKATGNNNNLQKLESIKEKLLKFNLLSTFAFETYLFRPVANVSRSNSKKSLSLHIKKSRLTRSERSFLKSKYY